MKFPVVGGTSADGVWTNPQVSRNLYPENDNGKIALIGTPGAEEYLDLGDPIRGWTRHKNDLMVVSGPSLIKVTDQGVANEIGTITQQSDIVSMDSSGFSVVMVDGGKAWYWKEPEFAQITDPDFPDSVSHVSFMDGFWLVVESNSGDFYASEQTYDPVGWNALDFENAGARPDDLIKIINDKNLLWAFGERSVEVYINTGNVDFPFEPIRQAMSHYGIEAANTLAPLDGRLIWLGVSREEGGRVVFMLSGSADPQKISDHRLDSFIHKLSREDIEGAIGYGMMWKGHPWYVLTFPDYEVYGRTFVFDASVSAWFEWSTLSNHSMRIGKFRGLRHIYFNGDHLVGDGEGKIYKLKDDVFTDGGLQIVRERVVDSISGEGKWIRFPEIQLDIDPGTGTPGTDYTVELSMSRDRGKTWGNSRSKSFGKGGEYTKTPIWYRNGRAKEATIRFRTSAACPVNIRGGFIRANV